MQRQSRLLKKLIRAVPGAKIFGIYRLLPAFFVFGAAIEFAMIHWTVGETNFYNTYKKRRVQEIVDNKLLQEQQSLTHTSSLRSESA